MAPSQRSATSSSVFPTGAVLSLPRRLALLAWARSARAWVIEDDYDSEYRYAGRPIEALQGLDRGGRVLYLGTLSKVLFPALRLGYLILPEPLVAPFVRAKALTDRHTSTFEQEVLADLIGEGHFERHLRRTRTRNAARRLVLLDALTTHLEGRVEVGGANAGVHVVVWLRGMAPGRLADLIERAARADVGVYPVTPHYPSPAPPGRAVAWLRFDERAGDPGRDPPAGGRPRRGPVTADRGRWQAGGCRQAPAGTGRGSLTQGA